MNIVKPFALAPGDYLELEDHCFIGPLVDHPLDDCVRTVESPGYWNRNGVPHDGARRILDVFKGPTGINAYIDRMSDSLNSSFARGNIRRAQVAIDRLKTADSAKPSPANAGPMSVGSAAEGALQQMIRTIIREELRAVLRQEVPQLIAEHGDIFAGSEMRLAVTLSPMRS